MKAYFLNLLGYDHHMNETMIQATLAAGNPDKAIEIMSHLLGAQQVWLGRVTKDPDAPQAPIWPKWSIEEMLKINEQNNKAWVECLLTQHEALNIFVEYANSKGEKFNDRLIDILTHLLNHGTHHRAQAGQILKYSGVEKLPSTDYIFYVRNPGS